MSKIWIVQNNSRYNKKHRIFKSEADMIKHLPNSTGYTVTEYELKSSQSGADYLKSRERDTQLRSVLGELSEYETNVLHLVELFTQLKKDVPNDRRKLVTIEHLKKIADNKKSVSNYLVQNKKYFLTVSDSVEWLLAILKCHNFQDHIYDHARWNSAERKYEKVDNTSQTFRDNFLLAKQQLRKQKVK